MHVRRRRVVAARLRRGSTSISRRTTRSILAVPTHAAAALVPGLDDAAGLPRHRQRPFQDRCAARTCRRCMGLVNATTEWMFAFAGRLSVTISSADRLMDVPRAELAQTIWHEVRQGHGNCRRACRRGRSCASGARPLRRRPPRMPSAPARARHGRTCSWPATGPRPDCRRRSKARCARATARPSSSDDGAGSHDGGPRGARAATSRRRRKALLDAQKPDGHWCFELEADATIPAEYVLLRHYLAEPVDAELERKIARLSAPHPGRARRLAAVPRRRVRHEREREGLFRAQDDRRRHRRAAHGARARGDALARRGGAAPTSSPSCCWRCSASFPGARCR